ncbi:transmembrane signal receptor [Lithospermum erythrorhizon]|uniref:Transmembrane signal receptor n=1 Tax=Lithospermum erythrorhizon TaxID=34254 RepID=A0AAV3PAF7_LITER
MKDLGVLKYFLGPKPAASPMEQNHTLSLAKGAGVRDPERYRRLVGRLIYLAFTRPDLAYSVHILAQFMLHPRQEDSDTALRVVSYLKGRPGQGILVTSASDLSLICWCDLDWASCPLTRRSLTGRIVFLGGSPISWKTKKQHNVSRSSAEAEYYYMAAVTSELKWLKALLLDFGIPHSRPMTLFCDSETALHIAQKPVFHELTKHIEVDCHYVRDVIRDGLLTTVHVSTAVQFADIFTKALSKEKFLYFVRTSWVFHSHKLGISFLPAPT